jgi:hypothetical protein
MILCSMRWNEITMGQGEGKRKTEQQAYLTRASHYPVAIQPLLISRTVFRYRDHTDVCHDYVMNTAANDSALT